MYYFHYYQFPCRCLRAITDGRDKALTLSITRLTLTSTYIMSKPPKLDDIVKYKKVSLQWIRQRCSREHLIEIAQKITSWETISSFLGLGPPEERIIRSENQFDYAKQKEAMLFKWDEKFSETGKATYETLMKAFLKIGNTSLAESVCDILKESPESLQND